MIFESNLLTFMYVCLLLEFLTNLQHSVQAVLIYIMKKTYTSFFNLLAAVKEQIQKANCEMIGYEEVVVGVPDFVGHLSEMDVMPQVSEAPASSAQVVAEWWTEQVQQPEALVVQEATVSLQVYLQCFSL